jgi:hypothetical protein
MSAKEIEGWEDYTIDIKGNVFSKRRNKYLKQTVDKYGYCKVNLHKDKKYKVITVHRLVAQAFIPNPNNYKCVNHIDGNKQNNCVENLEWCTYKHNMQEAYRLGLIKGGLKDKFGKDYPKKMHLIGMFKDGILLEKFYGTGEIKRKYGFAPSPIIDCCKGKHKKIYGYQWKFLELLEEIE